MDPVSVIGAFAALVSASNSGLILLQNLIKSTNTVERLQREFVVLRHVFQECGETVLGSIPEDVPQSIKEISHMCIEKYHELLKILEKFVNKPKMARMVLYAYHEHELMLCYNGFRDSVMLLRDLCSEMKMSHHLMQNSEGPAQCSDSAAPRDGRRRQSPANLAEDLAKRRKMQNRRSTKGPKGPPEVTVPGAAEIEDESIDCTWGYRVRHDAPTEALLRLAH